MSHVASLISHPSFLISCDNNETPSPVAMARAAPVLNARTLVVMPQLQAPSLKLTMGPSQTFSACRHAPKRVKLEPAEPPRRRTDEEKVEEWHLTVAWSCTLCECRPCKVLQPCPLRFFYINIAYTVAILMRLQHLASCSLCDCQQQIIARKLCSTQVLSACK